MKRLRILIVILTFSLAILFVFVLFQKKELSCKKNSPQELLQKLSTTERKSLSDLCKKLIFTSEVGYTLFGDKPISSLYDSGRFYEDEDLCYFQKHLFTLAQRYEKRLNAPQFAIVIEDNFPSRFIYLINKKAFLCTVEQNLSIFRSLLGNNISPSSLLNTVLDKNCGLQKALNENHVLFGILYGYGVENSLCFDRRSQLDPESYMHGFPPWKGIQDPRVNDKATLQDVETYSQKRWIKKTAPEKIAPSQGFATVKDELFELNKKLALVAGAEDPLCLLSSISLPEFVGDPESEETQKLISKYTVQRDILMKMITEDNFFDNVLEKFYSDN